MLCGCVERISRPSIGENLSNEFPNVSSEDYGPLGDDIAVDAGCAAEERPNRSSMSQLLTTRVALAGRIPHSTHCCLRNPTLAVYKGGVAVNWLTACASRQLAE